MCLPPPPRISPSLQLLPNRTLSRLGIKSRKVELFQVSNDYIINYEKENLLILMIFIFTHPLGESLSGPQIQDLADTFVKWYYELMNNLNASPHNSSSPAALTSSSSEPSSASSSVTSSSSNTSSTSTPDFRPDHFWPDASAKVCLQNANQNSELIQVRLKNKNKHNLFTRC